MIRPLLSPNPNPDLIAVQTLPNPMVQPTMKVYPNPGRDWLRIDLQQIDEATVYTISIYDRVGRVVYERPWEQELAVQDWQPGWYMVVLRDEQGTILARQAWIKY